MKKYARHDGAALKSTPEAVASGSLRIQGQPNLQGEFQASGLALHETCLKKRVCKHVLACDPVCMHAGVHVCICVCVHVCAWFVHVCWRDGEQKFRNNKIAVMLNH